MGASGGTVQFQPRNSSATGWRRARGSNPRCNSASSSAERQYMVLLSPAVVAVGEELADAAAAEHTGAFRHTLAADRGADGVEQAAGVGAHGRGDGQPLRPAERDEVDEGAADGPGERLLGQQGIGGELVL